MSLLWNKGCRNKRKTHLYFFTQILPFFFLTKWGQRQKHPVCQHMLFLFFFFFFCMSTSAAEDDGFPAAVERSMKTTKAPRPAGASLGLFVQPAVVWRREDWSRAETKKRAANGDFLTSGLSRTRNLMLLMLQQFWYRFSLVKVCKGWDGGGGEVSESYPSRGQPLAIRVGAHGQWTVEPHASICSTVSALERRGRRGRVSVHFPTKTQGSKSQPFTEFDFRVSG